MAPGPAVMTLAAVAAFAQTSSRPPEPQRMEVTVERETGERWTAVPPGFVFESGDRLRFRLRSNFSGHLYVMNYGSSGAYALLFPHRDSGTNNEIKAGSEYLVPSSEAYFRISGPPGQDLVYWVVTPVSIGAGSASAMTPLPKPPSAFRPQRLLPRCDDRMLRARGMCIDASAGARNVRPETLPENLAQLPRLQARDVLIMKKGDRSVISSTSADTGPFIYEFRLAHK